MTWNYFKFFFLDLVVKEEFASLERRNDPALKLLYLADEILIALQYLKYNSKIFHPLCHWIYIPFLRVTFSFHIKL